MEKSKSSVSIESHNHLIKMKLQDNTRQLYQLIEQCLDLAYWQSTQLETSTMQPRINIKKDNQQTIRLIKNQMEKMALGTSQYEECLTKISKKLLEDQLIQEQSNQMKVILKKYQQNIMPLRTQKIQKQNQLYIFMRSTYECFQDQYQNCLPTPDRLKGIQVKNKSKKQIMEHCRSFIKELKQIEGSLLQQIQNFNQNIEQQLELQMIQSNMSRATNKLQETFQIKQDEQDIRSQIQAKYRRIYEINRINQVYWKKQPLKPKQNDIKIVCPNLYSYIINQYEQNTCQNLCKDKNRQNYRRNKNSNIPNFSQMSQRDYYLFKVYNQKICRQTERYQKLKEEYQNYRKVYTFLKQQNKELMYNYQKIYTNKSSQYCNLLDNNIILEEKQNQQYLSLTQNNKNDSDSQKQNQGNQLQDKQQKKFCQFADEFVIVKKKKGTNQKIDQFLQMITPQFLKSTVMSSHEKHQHEPSQKKVKQNQKKIPQSRQDDKIKKQKQGKNQNNINTCII